MHLRLRKKYTSRKKGRSFERGRVFIAGVGLSVMLVVGVVTPLKPAHALFGLPDFSITLGDIPRLIGDAIAKALKTVADTTFKNQLSKALNTLAYNAAVDLATSGKGQHQAFETNFDKIYEDVRDQAVGEFAENILTYTSTGKCEFVGNSCKKDSQCDPVILDAGGNYVTDVPDEASYEVLKRDGVVPANSTFASQKCKLNPIAQLGGIDICTIPDPLVDIKIRTLALGNSSTRQKDAPTPRCDWNKLMENFKTLSEIRPKDLIKVSSRFNSGQNDLSVIISLNEKKKQDIFESERAKALSAIINQGLKPKTETVSDEVKTPSLLTGATYKQVLVTEPFEAIKKQTGSAVADAIGVFTNTLISKSIDRILNKGFNPDSDPTLAMQRSSFSSISGIAAAKLKFADLLRVDDLKTTRLGATTLLDQLSSGCDLGSSVSTLSTIDPDAFRDVHNCVIDQAFRQAIDGTLTVRQAIEEGLLSVQEGGVSSGNDRTKVIGSYTGGRGRSALAGSCGDCEPGLISLRSILVLRKYRIVPVGWELAARYITEIAQSDTLSDKDTVQEWTIKQIMDDYSDVSSPFYGLIDPDWILKAPVALREERATGENIIHEEFVRDQDTNGDGVPDEKDEPRRIVQRGTQVAHEETCIYEDENGCVGNFFGQCVEEKPVWRVEGKACQYGDGTFNTCQLFVRSDTKSRVSYLTNTTVNPGGDCNADVAGCRLYVRDEDSDGAWTTGSGDIYMDYDAESCNASDAGCIEFVRLTDARGSILSADELTTAVNNVVGASGFITDYESYGLVEKIYMHTADSTPRGGAPSCVAEDVACRSYEPRSFAGDSVNGVVDFATISNGSIANYNDECPEECVGYQPYTEHASGSLYPTSATVNMIADTGKQCSVSSVGCTEFTNLNSVAGGGESRVYYAAIRECVTEDTATARDYFTWEGDEDTGLQLHAWRFDSDSSGGPRYAVTPTDPASLCDATKYNLPKDDPAYNPDCREYLYNTNTGSVTRFYRLHSQIVFASDQCEPIRRTLTDVNGDGSITDADCTAPGGTVNNCVYYTIADQSKTCRASDMGCREYSSASASNAETIVHDTFENNDAAGWVHSNGVSATVSNVGYNSDSGLNSSGTNPNVIRKQIEIAQHKHYLVDFYSWDGKPVVTITGFDGRELSYSGSNVSADAPGPVWFHVTLGPFTSDIDGTATVELSQLGSFVDDVVIREATSDYLIQNSWTTPLSCDVTADRDATNPASHAGTSNESQLYCQEYRDIDARSTIYIKEFSRLCDKDKVGCEALIRTYESDSASSQTYGSVTVPQDEVVYVVNDSDYYCYSNDAGCTALGLQTVDRSGTITYDTQYRMLDPDHDTYGFEVSLCEASQNLCQEYQPDSGGIAQYFRDPQDRLCEYKTNVSVSIGGTPYVKSGWFVVESAPYEDTDICQLEGEGATRSIPVCDPGNPIDGCYTYTCPRNQSSCTEFQDPLFPEGCDKNLIAPADRAANPDAACDFYYLLKNTLTEGQRECEYIDARNGCVGLFETERGADSRFLRADCQPNCPYTEVGGEPQLVTPECEVDNEGVNPDSRPGCIP